MKISMILIAYLGCAAGVQLRTHPNAKVFIGGNLFAQLNNKLPAGVFHTKEDYLEASKYCWDELVKKPGFTKDGDWVVGAMKLEDTVKLKNGTKWNVMCMVGPSDRAVAKYSNNGGKMYSVPANWKATDALPGTIDLEQSGYFNEGDYEANKLVTLSGNDLALPTGSHTVNYGYHFSYTPGDLNADHFTLKMKGDVVGSRYLKSKGFSFDGKAFTKDDKVPVEAQQALMALKKAMFEEPASKNNTKKSPKNAAPASPQTWPAPPEVKNPSAAPRIEQTEAEAAQWQREQAQMAAEAAPVATMVAAPVAPAATPRPTSAPGNPDVPYNHVKVRSFLKRARKAMSAKDQAALRSLAATIAEQNVLAKIAREVEEASSSAAA